MLRSTFLWLSEHAGTFEFVKRNPVARRVASRFVAGETLDAAVEAGKRLNARDISVSLDLPDLRRTGAKSRASDVSFT